MVSGDEKTDARFLLVLVARLLSPLEASLLVGLHPGTGPGG